VPPGPAKTARGTKHEKGMTRGRDRRTTAFNTRGVHIKAEALSQQQKKERKKFGAEN